ncbi:MAG: reverse transcriptase domain-containing protein [Candidatus Thiodiazotropha endolucinida]|nr:hypothetical protein [Candidatus Thiodiazotropha taylori]MCW4346602.1 reverse transcriptase domain-containing protein [Candidatus Thiodiazotropha endolucinida]
MAILLEQAGDIEKNPGPEHDQESDTSSSFPAFQGNFSVVHYNVQSLLNKVGIIEPEFRHFDVISLTETWLNDSVPTEDLLFDDFQTPFRRDRVGDSHGGIVVYVKNGIPCKRRADLELINIECLWIELKIKNRNILVGTFYRPPNSTPLVLTNIDDSIGLALDTGISDITILGDFNINMLNRQSERKISDICKQYNLTQLIDEPTNFSEFSSSIIDLLFVSNIHSVAVSGVGEPFLMQDIRYHCPIFSIFKFKRQTFKPFTRQIWLYESGNYDDLRQEVSDFDWTSICNENVNVYATNFTQKLLSLVANHIPSKTITVRPRDLPWMNNTIRKQMRKRNRLYKKYKRDNSIDNYNNFKILRNEVICLLRKSKQNYIDSLALKLKSNTLTSKDYWKTLKSFIKPTQSSTIPPLYHNSTYVSDSVEKADLLNNYFAQQTLLDDRFSILPDPMDRYGPSLHNIQFTPSEVQGILKSLELGKSTGPDNVNNKILKELATPLSKPLCDLFNSSMSKGIFPDLWKEANVTPLHKKDDPSMVSNYRPISLLSTVGKIMEKIVHKHMFNFFLDQHAITSLQSGFVPGDSTVNQLVDIYNTFCKALDDGKEVRAIFCDVSKAFDRVWHRGLLYKLKQAGIDTTLLQWLVSYLSNRKQRVVIPGACSDWVSIEAGVPQGSILGPLLFLIYINDIVLEINSNVRLFADDTSLYLIVNDPNEAARQLNFDLEAIHRWAERWLVKFNPSKSEALLISRKTNRPIHPQLIMNNEAINEVNSHKHLGIFLSNNGTWHEHIDYITSKAWARINIMRKLKFILDSRSLETIYLSFIRPVLEYADVVWDNCAQYEKNALEKVQLEAARIVTGTTKLVSVELLYKETGWETLEERRQNHKLCLFYKMSTGLSPNYLSSLIPPIFDDTTPYNLRDSHNIRPVMARTQLYYNSFIPASIRLWNDTSSDVRESTSVFSLKSNLSKNKNKPPKYYNTGQRGLQIQHTRLRTNCSILKHHLFSKNIIDDPHCICGAIETTKHFFLECQRFDIERIVLLNSLSPICTPNLKSILFGDSSLDNHANTQIFLAVQKFIFESKRFKT